MPIPLPDPLASQHGVREEIEISLGVIEAATWPPRHKVHKYWGRKPANVVQAYIAHFTAPGDAVLDPFCGSAVVPVEAGLMGRVGLGVDNNPVAVELGSALGSPVDPSTFANAARRVVAAVRRQVAPWYATRCEACGQTTPLRSLAYDGSTPTEIRYGCVHCKHRAAHTPRPDDLALAARTPPEADRAPDADILFGWEMQKLRRAGIRRWSELFTPRNLATATLLREAIEDEPDGNTRRWLRVTFSSALAQFTRMIADFKGRAGGPSWKLNCYWLPRAWQELHPLHYFESRVSRTERALVDLQRHPPGEVSTLLGDSRELPFPDNSVDYVFTDPPYGGEGIQYGELSMLWGLWLGHPPRLDTEVAFNPYRDFDQAHYAAGLADVFAEIARVLKPGGFATVAFANKDPEVWSALLAACRGAGLALEAAVPMRRSAPGLTESTMRRAPKADLLLTFQLDPLRDRTHQPAAAYPLAERTRTLWAMLRDQRPGADTHDLLDRVTIDWFSWLYEGEAHPSAQQPTLDAIESHLWGGTRPKTSSDAQVPPQPKKARG